MAENKEIVLVTGGNTGIGFETIKALLRSSKPYLILLGCRDPRKGEQALAELYDEFPNAARSIDIVLIDIAEDEDIKNLFQYVKSEYGRVDILINNAGTFS